jgi:hypothetical protein
MSKTRKEIVERRGKIAEQGRSFDVHFWQSQTPQARFDATWEMIIYAWRVKGNDVRQLRLQRSVETFQRQQWCPQDFIDADLLSRTEGS